MRRAAGCLAIAGLLLAAACAPPPASVTTSIRESDCSAPAADVQARFAEKDLGVQRCQGALGWDVLVVSSDANSWLELRSATASWSSESAVVYETPIGLFPGVRSDAPLEWRSERGEPTALLFTVSAQNPEDAETRVDRVFVARFDDTVPVCVIGRVASLAEARELADSDRACSG